MRFYVSWDTKNLDADWMQAESQMPTESRPLIGVRGLVWLCAVARCFLRELITGRPSSVGKQNSLRPGPVSEGQGGSGEEVVFLGVVFGSAE